MGVGTAGEFQHRAQDGDLHPRATLSATELDLVIIQPQPIRPIGVVHAAIVQEGQDLFRVAAVVRRSGREICQQITNGFGRVTLVGADRPGRASLGPSGHVFPFCQLAVFIQDPTSIMAMPGSRPSERSYPPRAFPGSRFRALARRQAARCVRARLLRRSSRRGYAPDDAGT
jgi:hypothetical protein